MLVLHSEVINYTVPTFLHLNVTCIIVPSCNNRLLLCYWVNITIFHQPQQTPGFKAKDSMSAFGIQTVSNMGETQASTWENPLNISWRGCTVVKYWIKIKCDFTHQESTGNLTPCRRGREMMKTLWATIWSDRRPWAHHPQDISLIHPSQLYPCSCQ